MPVIFILIWNYSSLYPVDADHFGIGTLGDIIGAGTGIQSHKAQLRNLLSEEQDVQSGGLPSHSVSSAVGAGFSAGFL